MFVETHCHLDFPEFDQDRDEVIKRAEEQDIGCIINIGASLKGSLDSLGLAKRYAFIYATAGIHPHEADRFDAKIFESIKEIAQEDKVVAIGEIGLDYYRNYSHPDKQKTLFVSLINLAKDLNLPLVIHTRSSQSDTLNIVKKAMPINAVVHCFSGDADFLKECLELGFLASFTCNITYKKAQNLRDIVKLVPIDRLLLETDAPYLAPQGLRGKRNEPANVKFLAEEIARIKQISIEEVAAITTDNARKFFGLR